MSIHGRLSHSFEESHSICIVLHISSVSSEGHKFFSRSFAHCAHLQVCLWDKPLEVGIQCVFFKGVLSTLEEVEVLPTKTDLRGKEKKIDFL